MLAGLKACETAENGQFFISADGKATFRNRAYKFTNALATTSQATFDNSGSNFTYTMFKYLLMTMKYKQLFMDKKRLNSVHADADS